MQHRLLHGQAGGQWPWREQKFVARGRQVGLRLHKRQGSDHAASACGLTTISGPDQAVEGIARVDCLGGGAVALRARNILPVRRTQCRRPLELDARSGNPGQGDALG